MRTTTSHPLPSCQELLSGRGRPNRKIPYIIREEQTYQADVLARETLGVGWEIAVPLRAPVLVLNQGDN